MDILASDSYCFSEKRNQGNDSISEIYIVILILAKTDFDSTYLNIL